MVANIGGPADTEQVIQLGGEGVGLLRSEFLFMKRMQAPTEDEQYEAYSNVARTLGPTRPLIIRTLDVGGDKPLPYLPIPPEENPFLGERGIRVGLNCPDMTSPSSGVSPIDVSIESPPLIAVAEQPLPKWSVIMFVASRAMLRITR